MTHLTSLTFACPRCHSPLELAGPDVLNCPQEQLVFKRIDHIWRMLLTEREAVYSQFIREYEAVRRAEGRGANKAEFYRSLPYHDLSGRKIADWHIRAASFDAFLKHVVQPMVEQGGKPLRVLDLGAGNGWLSNRLAERGHIVAAVDLTINDFDGLGCFRYYDTAFTPVQAEFDDLPFTDQSVDLVVFNAALHYSTGYEKTLGESLRVLTPTGTLVILDSPFYRDNTSGEKMIRERENQYVNRYGFPSNALPIENYLTYQRLSELTAALRVNCKIITPWYGMQWRLRPLKACLLGQREPAKFHLVVFTPF